jgi:DedD protein
MATLWEERLEFPDSSEVHWSASTVMAVFMAASLVSAVFFGLGYSFGRGGTLKPALTQAVAPRPEILVPTPATSLVHRAVHPTLQAASSSTPVVQHPILDGGPQREVAPLRPVVLPAKVHTDPSAAVRKESHALGSASSKRKVVQQSPVSHYMVQVGAVGDRKDARRLVSQLRQHGFRAAIYPAKHDKFLHVQIGPFANMQEAQAMRHHVLANGYRAILKHAS